MKRISILLLSMLASTIAFLSCEEDKLTYSLDATPKELSFDAENTVAVMVTVTAENVNWAAEKNDAADTWYSLATEGNSVTVKVDDNTLVEPRSAKFTITSDVESIPAVEISVEQSGIAATLELSTASLKFNAAAGEQEVDVAGSEWSASVDMEWVSITPQSGTDGTITVSVTSNDTPDHRTATLTVSNAAGEKTVAIEQGAYGEILLDKETLKFTAMGEEPQKVTVTGPGWNASVDANWVTITPQSGSDGTIAVSVTPNDTTAERTATLTVGNATSEKTVTITQAGVTDLALTDSAIWFPYAGETKNSLVISAPGWTITSDQPWLTVTKTSEDGFTSTTTANDGEERMATLTVTNIIGTTTVLVRQAGATGVSFRSGIAGFHGTYYGYNKGNFVVEIFSGDDPRASIENGYYLAIDFITPIPSLTGDYLDIAPGTYAINDSMEQYTISAEPTGYTTMLQYINRAYTAIHITGGQVTVSGSAESYHMDFDFDIVGGNKFVGSFDGRLLIKNEGWQPPVQHDGIEAGTVNNATVDLHYGGDMFGLGNDAWFIDVYSSTVHKDGNTFMGDGYVLSSQMTAVLGDGTYMPDAEYTLKNNASLAPSALTGFIEEGSNAFRGTWMHKVEGGKIVYSLPVAVGSIITSHSGNAYTFVVNAIDTEGATIKATFTGNATVGPLSSSAAHKNPTVGSFAATRNIRHINSFM